MGMIGMFIVGKAITYEQTNRDNEFVMQHIYTDDESDVTYRNITNKTDGAVKRKIVTEYCDKIKQMRADKERAAQLDAFNYLDDKNLKL